MAEFTWDGVFFGESKRNEPIVKKNSWKEPNECVKILNNFMKNETVLNLSKLWYFAPYFPCTFSGNAGNVNFEPFPAGINFIFIVYASFNGILENTSSSFPAISPPSSSAISFKCFLNLIVTETWINVDVTISSFQPRPVGAYGNVEYSITFVAAFIHHHDTVSDF